MPENPFAKYAPRRPGTLPSPPKAVTPVERERTDLQRRTVEVSERRERRDSAEDTREAAEERRRRAQAYEAAQTNIERVIGKIDQIAHDAGDNYGWGETGTTGRIMRNMPLVQTPAKDLEANISTLRANFAFDALQAMRDASKTGGALGAISEKELKLLEDTVANIDPGQSHDQFIQNLGEARVEYLRRLRQIDPEAARRLSLLERTGRKANRRSNPDDIEEIMRKYGDD